MKIEGQHVFAASPELLWDAVTDPTVLAKVLPGCEDFHAVGDGGSDAQEFEGKLKIKVGPVQGDFLGNVTLSELAPPHSYRLKIKGKGAPGFVEGEGLVELIPEEGGGTLLRYAVDAKIGGRIATVGQRLLDSSSKVITRQALEGLEQQVGARIAAHEAGAAEAEAAEAERQAGEAADAAARAEAEEKAAAARAAAGAKSAAAEAAQEKASQTPSQSEFAATFAKELAQEMIPKPLRGVLAGVILVLAIAAVVFLVRGC